MTEKVRSEAPGGPEAFDRAMADADLQLNRGLVWGPKDSQEEHELRKDGWDPSVAYSSAQKRAEQEREQATRLSEDPKWRRGRLRDVVAARYLAFEMEETREKVLAHTGLLIDDSVGTIESARRFTDSMPAADVWITLMTAKHRSADTRWTPNDIFDVDALSVAAAYCDYVVTERNAAHVLKIAKLDDRLKTAILTDLNQLAEHASGA